MQRALWMQMRRPQKRIAHLSRRVFRFDGEKRGELERVCTSRCDSMNYELLFARQNTTDAKTTLVANEATSTDGFRTLREKC